MSDAQALLTQLRAHAPADAKEVRDHAFIIHFLETEKKPFSRKTLHGHITASAFVVDAAYERVLLVWHRKLKRWLQPGGHVDKADASPCHAARREVLEETGRETMAGRLGAQLFDVDVHTIPARGDEPEHQHLDIRYLFEAGAEVHAPDHEVKWLTVDEARVDADPSTLRALAKIAKLKSV